MSDAAAFEHWVRAAHAVRLDGFLKRRGMWTPAMSGDRGVPCPVCGGRDRFAVNLRKNVFHCRSSGAGGGPVALWAYLEGRTPPLRGQDFLDACEELTGEPPPRDEAGSEEERAQARKKRAEALARQRAAAAEAERKRAMEDRNRRDWMRREAFALWRAAVDARGTMVADYYALRRLPPPWEFWPEVRIRFAPDLPYQERRGGALATLHRGPAMVLPMVGPDFAESSGGRILRRFAGVHVTWIDLAQPKGKIAVADPDRPGEMLAAKKTFASWRGAVIDLSGGLETATRWLAGEGVETVVAGFAFLRRARSALLPGLGVCSFINLENFAGKAAGTVAHSHLTQTDSRGRTRARRVRGPKPLWPDPVRPVPVPGAVDELIWLKDGDSEAEFTGHAVARGATRYCRHFPHLTLRLADPGPGVDFSDLWARHETGAAP